MSSASSQIPKGEATGRRLSCRFRNCSEASRAKLLLKTIAGAEGEGKNRERGYIVSPVQENAGVAYVQVSNVVGLAKAIGDKLRGVIAHAACAGFVQAVTAHFGFIGSIFQNSTGRMQYVGADLFCMLKHLQLVISPLEVNTDLWNSKRIFRFRVDIHKVLVGGNSWALHGQTDRRRIAALDFALERRAETLDLMVVRRELRTDRKSTRLNSSHANISYA